MALDLDLGKMIGPLPLGAWVATIGGGLALMAYTRRQSTDIVTAPVEEMVSGNTEPGVGDGSVGGWVPTYPSTGTGDDSVSGDPDTNEAWGRMAINGLIAMNYNPSVSDAAIRKYLEGAKLSASEYALVTIALGKYGAPPVVLPAPIFGPPTLPKVTTGTKGKPTAPTKPKPVSKPHVRYYTVRPGDTLSKIGKKYHVSWQSIYNANRKRIKNPNVIVPGWRLVIPNS